MVKLRCLRFHYLNTLPSVLHCEYEMVFKYKFQMYPVYELLDHAVPFALLIFLAVLAVVHLLDVEAEAQHEGDLLQQVDAVALVLVVARQQSVVLLQHRVRRVLEHTEEKHVLGDFFLKVRTHPVL